MKTDATAYSDIREAMLEVLRQGIQLLESISDDDYICRIPSVFGGSIGAHYRHCLEHFEIILGGTAGGEIDYDGRARSRTLESDRSNALGKTQELVGRIETTRPAALLDGVVTVCCAVSTARVDSPRVASSLAREAIYGVAHAVHHYALIAVMAHALELRLPENFGMAPSTVAHLQSMSRGEPIDEVIRS